MHAYPPHSVLGCGARVVCLSCGSESDRYEFQEQLKQLNPDAAAAVAQLQKAGADRVRTSAALVPLSVCRAASS